MVSIPLATRIFSNDLLLRLTHHTDMTEILLKQSINLYLLASVPTPLHLPPPPHPPFLPPRPPPSPTHTYNPVWQHTFISPSAFSRRAVVSYLRKYVHEVLVNRLGGHSLPKKSVVRLTDRPDMTLDVYRGRKTTKQQQHKHTSLR